MIVKLTYNISNPFISVNNNNPIVYINVGYGGGGGSSSVVWGAITGTLSDQVDLQNALDAKLDEPLLAGGTAGQLLAKNTATDYDWSWIDNYTEDIRDTVKATETIAKGKAVYISGANGTNQLASLADYTTEIKSSQTIGIALQNFATNGIGQIITQGLLSGIDTSSATAGDPIWLGANGALIFGLTNKPSAPYHMVYLGVVTRANAINGEIYVKIANGFELQELHNVSAQTPTNNDGLFYESSTSLWKNKSISTVLGYTPANASNVVPNTRTLTINGTAYDLSADRSWTTPSGTVTSVAMTTPTGLTVTGSPITSSGTLALSLTSGYAIPTTIKQSNWDDAYTWVSAFPTQTGNSGKYLTTNGSALSWSTISDTNIYNTDGTLTASRTVSLSTFSLTFAGTSSSRFFSNGNVVIGGTTDAGYKLDVQGTGRFTGDVQFATSTTFDFGIGTSGGSLFIKSRFPTTNGNANGIKINGGNTASAGTNILYATNTGNNTLYAPILQWSGRGVLISYNDADNTTNDTTSILELKSTTKGFLPPRMTSAQRTAISTPAVGLLAYQTDGTEGTYEYTSTGWRIINSAGGSGTVTSVSVVSTNGFTGTVANATTTPAITLTTSITGVLKGNGTAISAATAGTDYQAPITLSVSGTTGDATFSSNTLTIPKYDSVTASRQTGSYTLVLTDRGKLIEMNVATANTLTVPLNSSVAFPIGTKIDISQYGAGATTITATSGVTIRSLSGYLKLAGQYVGVTLVKIGTDEWYCFGNLIA